MFQGERYLILSHHVSSVIILREATQTLFRPNYEESGWVKLRQTGTHTMRTKRENSLQEHPPILEGRNQWTNETWARKVWGRRVTRGKQLNPDHSTKPARLLLSLHVNHNFRPASVYPYRDEVSRVCSQGVGEPRPRVMFLLGLRKPSQTIRRRRAQCRTN